MATYYQTYDISLMEDGSQNAANTVGGVVQVCIAGTMRKATLTDPDNNHAVLANPVSIVRGKMRFEISNASGVPTQCDIYGVSGSGRAFSRLAVKANGLSEVFVDQPSTMQLLRVPFSAVDCTPGTEKDTGFILPANGATIILPTPVALVTVAAGQAAKTLGFGLLSSQAGGNATGFMTGLSLTAIAQFIASEKATPNIGALLSELSSLSAAQLPVSFPTNATAVNISYTLTAGTTLVEGLMVIPYYLPFGQPLVP